jgi:predicted HTH transcriptional regulator
MITQDELRELIELKREGVTLDYKRDLNLETKEAKAEFVKDVLALANSGRTAYIVTGIKDKTWEPVGISKSYSQAQLNQILQDRTDPPIRLEYAEI